jgi:penicillin-binding protein 2
MHSSSRENDFEANPWRMLILGVFMAGVLLVLAGRLVMLQILDTEGYRTKAETQSQRLVILPAPRGNIYDRNGRLLVGNCPSRNVVVDLSSQQLLSAFEEERRRLRRDERTLRGKMPGGGTEKKQAATAGKSRTPEERRSLRQRAADINLLAPALVLQRQLDYLNAVTGRDETLDLRDLERHLSLATGKRAIPFPLMRGISEAEASRFFEQVSLDSPLKLLTESIRTYPLGTVAAHVLGYVGRDTTTPPVPAEPGSDPELATFLTLDPHARNRQTLKRFDGQRAVSGVEHRFNNEGLAGTPGYQIWRVRINGYAYQMDSSAPATQGAGVNLSLDIELQKAIEDALAKHYPEHRAAVVALDIDTGEVLACVNSPSYDPSRMAQGPYYREQEQAGNVMNHAVLGLYPPGSSFKPVTAIAALRSGIFTPETERDCDSYFLVGDGRAARRFPEHDRKAFGKVNIARMLEVSSNVFCYQAGLEIGPERLAAEGKRLGLDSPTSLELGTPRNTLVPDPRGRRSRGAGWSLGDTANTAIGQGDNLTTVVHLAAMTASIARNETRTDITILRSPERDTATLPDGRTRRYKHRGLPDKQTPEGRRESPPCEPIGLTPEGYNAIIEGLVNCATRGTGRTVKFGNRAAGIQYDLGSLTVAAKTGTAQVRNNTSTLAWTIAFAPVETPRIALAVMVEGKKDDKSLSGGRNAGPIAHIVLGEWLRLQKQPAPAPQP